MKQTPPNKEIINDLLTENWQLRWQVLEIFHRVYVNYHNHAIGSHAQKEVLRLGQNLAATLNGASDHNLHLIMTAAYFLGGSNFIFLIFQHLGIDDSKDFYPAASNLKINLNNKKDDSTFYDYFHSLLSSSRTIERTTIIAAAIAIRIFSPLKSLSLLISIPHSEPQTTAFELFAEAYPNQFFNDYLLLERKNILHEIPALLQFIGPPVSPEQTQICITSVSYLFANSIDRSIALKAIGRLKLDSCSRRLNEFEINDLETATIYAQLGDKQGCRKLIAISKSWRYKKRCMALTALAFCNSRKALTTLTNRVAKGDKYERRLALNALGKNLHPEAITSLITIFAQENRNRERRQILALLSLHPKAVPDPKTANFLAHWHNDNSLYPELLEALAVFGFGDRWEEIIARFSMPLQSVNQKKIALFMTRFADRQPIKTKLLELLHDLDWTFSFNLLTLLQPNFKAQDLKNLLNLLQRCENTCEPTIHERLTRGATPSGFCDNLSIFLNSNSDQARQVLRLFIAELMTGSRPTEQELYDKFEQQPLELKKLFLDYGNFSKNLAKAELPLLHFQQLLSKITLDNNDCLTAVIHQTRKYRGFFRQRICTIISTIIDHDHNLQDTKYLPDLQLIINFIRRRPNYDKLREKILWQIRKTSRNARDLKLYPGAGQDRDLRIFEIKRE
ncbi:MAG: HEAT repeat domain-containing protein [Deltaproteobacteria bacterium]|nr:HEAT repeat domain-containing protein [Candidatus Tharpella sp.]